MNQMEKMLQALIKDPLMMKKIALLASKRGALNKEKKLKDAGSPTHVNEVLITCKLCQTSRVIWMRMDFDKTDKIYRGGCHSTHNYWLDLPLFKLTQRCPTCPSCSKVLALLSHDELISKLITQAERNNSNGH